MALAEEGGAEHWQPLVTDYVLPKWRELLSPCSVPNPAGRAVQGLRWFEFSGSQSYLTEGVIPHWTDTQYSVTCTFALARFVACLGETRWRAFKNLQVSSWVLSSSSSIKATRASSAADTSLDLVDYQAGALILNQDMLSSCSLGGYRCKPCMHVCLCKIPET